MFIVSKRPLNFLKMGWYLMLLKEKLQEQACFAGFINGRLWAIQVGLKKRVSLIFMMEKGICKHYLPI